MGAPLPRTRPPAVGGRGCQQRHRLLLCSPVQAERPPGHISLPFPAPAICRNCTTVMPGEGMAGLLWVGDPTGSSPRPSGQGLGCWVSVHGRTSCTVLGLSLHCARGGHGQWHDSHGHSLLQARCPCSHSAGTGGVFTGAALAPSQASPACQQKKRMSGYSWSRQHVVSVG